MPSEIFVFLHTHMSSGGRYKKGRNGAGCEHWHGEDKDKHSDNRKKNEFQKRKQRRMRRLEGRGRGKDTFLCGKLTVDGVLAELLLMSRKLISRD